MVALVVADKETNSMLGLHCFYLGVGVRVPDSEMIGKKTINHLKNDRNNWKLIDSIIIIDCSMNSDMLGDTILRTIIFKYRKTIFQHWIYLVHIYLLYHFAFS